MPRLALVLLATALALAACSLVIDGRLGVEPDPPVSNCP